MTTERKSRIRISGIPVEVIRKDIKNLHLAVYPPAGRVRVAAPKQMTIAAIRLAVIYRLTWIKKQRLNFQSQERASLPQYVDGESHDFRGRRYRLRILPTGDRPVVAIRGSRIEIKTPRTSRARRAELLGRFYREELKKVALPLVEKWADRMVLPVPGCGVRRMKRNWGTYSRKSRKIWLNPDLAKKPIRCIEYIVVHEMIHSLVPNHGEKFQARMKKYLPNWEALRNELNRGSIS